MRAIVRDLDGRGRNLPPLPGIFPDYEAPVVTRGPNGVRSLEMMRWGFPPPPFVKGSHTVQNVRNLSSGYWKKWLSIDEGAGGRCLVPATAFSEYQDGPSPKDIVWFARQAEGADMRPLFFFPGIWRPFEGERGPKTARVAGMHKIFAFLTAAPNAVVAPVHAKAMPVILTTPDECDRWLDAEPANALDLQCSAADDVLTIVARGKARKDEG